MGGRRVAYIVPDPERADLVHSAFELYATGGYSVAQLTDELAERGLRGRGRRDRPEKPLVVSSVADLLANPVYTGVVEWQGVTYQVSTSHWSMKPPSTASSNCLPQGPSAAPAIVATTMSSIRTGTRMPS
jgi:Recombinase